LKLRELAKLLLTGATLLSGAVGLLSQATAEISPRVRCLGGAMQPDDIISACNEAINQYPKDAELWNRRGVEREKQGRPDSAIANLNTAIRLKPDYTLAYRNRARIYARKGDSARAITDLNEAIRLDPKLSEAYYLRGLEEERLGNPKKALGDYEKAVELRPSHEDALGAVRRVKLALGLLPPPSNATTDAALCVNPDVVGPEGIVACEGAIKKDPRNATLWNMLGERHFKLGSYDRAIADYNETVKLEPKHPTAYLGLASTWEKKGDAQLAAEFLKLHKKQEATASSKPAPPPSRTRDADYAKTPMPPPASGDDPSAIAELLVAYLPQIAFVLIFLTAVVGVGLSFTRRKSAPADRPALAPPFPSPRNAAPDYRRPPPAEEPIQRSPRAAQDGPLQQNEVLFLVEALESLCRLREQGVLEEAEFIEEKKRVLAGRFSALTTG
jgi:tetratricopeptide (TPR) repeat protein